MRIARILLIGLILSVVSPCPRTDAQELATEVDRARMEMLFAHELARRAVYGLQTKQQPTREDYVLAVELLDVAARLAGDDPDIVRLLIEAAEWADDRQTVISATRRLVAKDRDDHVAKLRLVDHTIRQQQHGERRLRAYERILAEADESLHETIRSRLAYDAAVLAREMGDLERFSQLLLHAIELDGTNKAAAALAAAFHADRRADKPIEQLELLLNLLHADPMDQSTFIAVARHLLAHGAYEQANRFIEAGANLMGALGMQISESVFTLRLLTIWSKGSDHEALQMLERYQTGLSRQERYRRLQELEEENRRRERFGEPFTPIDWNNPPFQDLIVELPVSLEWLRAMIAEATGRQAMAQVSARKVIAALDEYVARSRQDLAQLEEARDLPAALRESQMEMVRSDLSSLLGESILARLLFNAGRDQVPMLLDAYLADERVRPAARDRFRGWLALREDRLDEARRYLQRAGDDALARLGLALLEAREGDLREAMRHEAAVWRAQPDTQIGMYARSSLEQRLGRPAPALSSTALEMEALAARSVADDLLYLWIDPSRVVNLRLEPVAREIQYLDQPRLRITLRNASRYPLAVGPESPLSSRAMIVAGVRLDGRSVQARFLPLVIDLNRRFRLDPRQSFTIETNIARDQHVEFTWATPTANVMLRYRGITDFTATPTGQYVAGPMGVETLADEIVSFGVPRTHRDPRGLLVHLDKAWGVQRFRLLSVAIAILATPEERGIEQFGPEAKRVILAGLLERFDVFDDLERAWLLIRGSGATALPAGSPLIERAILAEGKLTTIAYLATKASTIDDPVLLWALEHESEQVRAVARARRAGILAQATDQPRETQQAPRR